MKITKYFLQSMINNYRPRNFEEDFIIHKIKNIVLILDNLSTSEIKRLANCVNKIINSNYFTGTITVFGWDDEQLSIVISKIKEKEHYSNFKLNINISRNSKISSLSKLSELEKKDLLFIIPSYEKSIFDTYLNLLNITDYKTLCLKSNFKNNVFNSYKNAKIINKIKKSH